MKKQKRKKLCKNSLWPMPVGSTCPDCRHSAVVHPAEKGAVCGMCEIEDAVRRAKNLMRKR